MRCERFLISGMVQGVGFRFWAVRQAGRLGLDGYVRNLPDGRVELVASGPKSAVDQMADLCRNGPGSGRVDGVQRLPCGDRRIGGGFTVRR